MTFLSRVLRSVILLGMLTLTAGAPFSLGADDDEATSKNSAFALSPDVLGAKALLEELLSKRYSQELATILDRRSFTVGTNLELVAALPNGGNGSTSEDELPADLLLGSLNPDDVLKNFADVDTGLRIHTFLTNFRIKFVNVSVGLNEKPSKEVQDKVDKWLTNRLKAEFGQAGQGTVSVVQLPSGRGILGRPWIEWLSQFQNLAGQILIALALAVGIFLWKKTLSKDARALSAAAKEQSAAAGAQTSQMNLKLDQPLGGAGAKPGAETAVKTKEDEDGRASEEIHQMTKQLSGLAPALSQQSEGVLRSWCQAGEEGLMKLACFAEAVGKDMGKLPIPVDALGDLAKVFSKMPNLKVSEKRDVIRKVYWDPLAVINLGIEALEQPFNYLGGMRVSMVNEILIEQNPRMKALVTLYMPPVLRQNYFKSLDVEAKRALLQEAAELKDMPSGELKSFDGSLKMKMRGGDQKDMVSFGLALGKIASALTPSEEISLLAEVSGSSVGDFKRTVPSLAFLQEWPDEVLARLFAQTPTEQMVAYLRLKPDLKDRFLALCPPLTAEIAADDLGREDTMKPDQRDAILLGFREQLKKMVDENLVSLEEIFSDKNQQGSGNGQGQGNGQDASAGKAA